MSFTSIYFGFVAKCYLFLSAFSDFLISNSLASAWGIQTFALDSNFMYASNKTFNSALGYVTRNNLP